MEPTHNHKGIKIQETADGHLIIQAKIRLTTKGKRADRRDVRATMKMFPKGERSPQPHRQAGAGKLLSILLNKNDKIIQIYQHSIGLQSESQIDAIAGQPAAFPLGLVRASASGPAGGYAAE